MLTDEIIKDLLSGNREQQLKQSRFINKILSEDNPPIDEVIEAGLVTKFVDLIKQDDSDLQFESSCVLTNVASGNSRQTYSIIETGAIPTFIQLLKTSNLKVKEQIVWVLGNIAGDSPKFRDLLLDSGVLSPLLDIISQNFNLSLTQLATWVLSNLCKDKHNMVDIDKIEPAFPILKKTLLNSDIEILCNSCWAIAFISDGSHDYIKKIIDYGFCPIMIEMLRNASTKVVHPALRLVGNIASDTHTGCETHVQIILDNGVLECLYELTYSSNQSIKLDACSTLSNILEGNAFQINLVYEKNIFPRLIELLSCDNSKVQIEATWAIYNATINRLPKLIEYLIKSNLVLKLCELLDSDNLTLIDLSLRILKCLLLYNRNNKNVDDDLNLCALEIKICGGLEKIEFLTQHFNEDIKIKSENIIQDFFIEI